MKKLLLTSAIVAVAGAAAAEITLSGDALVGFRTHDDDGRENLDGANGLYSSAGIEATGTSDLNDGLKASVTYGFDLDYTVERDNDTTPDDGATLPNYGGDVVGLDNYPTIKLESSVATMTVGDVDHAAHELFKAAGADMKWHWGVDNPGTASVDVEPGFTEQDAEMVGRVDTTVSTFAVGVSYVVADGYKKNVSTGEETRWDDVGLPMNSYTIGANGSFSGFEMSLGYEFNEDTEDSAYGISTGYSMAGITGRIMYGSSSAGAEGDDTQMNEIGISGNYEMSNGIKLGGGVSFFSGTLANGDDAPSATAYFIEAGFKAMGADITAGYKGASTDLEEWGATSAQADDAVMGGVYVDAAYEIEGTGVTLLGGYDSMETIVLSDADNVGEYGAFYLGTSYDLGGGASIFATYSNGDEIGKPEYEPGARFGVKMTF